MADFTPTQGRYLAFIHAYSARHGFPPAESDIVAAMCVSPPSVNQMVKTLEKKGLILRHPGQARALELLVPEDEIPGWNNRKQSASPARRGNVQRRIAMMPSQSPANLFVLAVYLTGGPLGEKFRNKEFSRVIEIRGDQTLDMMHQAIFNAYDRQEEHYIATNFSSANVRSLQAVQIIGP